MTILIGLAPRSKGHAALHLGAMLARSRVEDVAVCTVEKVPWPPDPNRSDREYIAYQQQIAAVALEHARSYLGSGPLGVEYAQRRAPSAAAGLLEFIAERQVSTVVLGSSSAGMLGHVMLGGVAERVMHGAELPVAVPPTRLPGRSCDRGGACQRRVRSRRPRQSAAAQGRRHRARPVRITARGLLRSSPDGPVLEAVEPGAEHAVVAEWQRRLEEDLTSTMETLPAAPRRPGEATAVATRVPVVVGEGDSWGEALHDVAWTSGDVLVVGTSRGPFSRIFLGSHAAKIVRNSPVPVVLVPRG